MFCWFKNMFCWFWYFRKIPKIKGSQGDRRGRHKPTGRAHPPGHALMACGPLVRLPDPVFFLDMYSDLEKIIIYTLVCFDHRIASFSFVLVSCYFSDRFKSNMSSQDSEGEIYVSNLIVNPQVYGDVDPYGWSMEEEVELT